MTSFEKELGRLLGIQRRPRRQPRSRLVAVYPSGRRFVMRLEHGHWIWHPNGSGSFPQAAAIENAERAGATVVREPIPEGGER